MKRTIKTIIGFDEEGKIYINYIKKIIKSNIDEYCIKNVNDGHRKW